MNKPSKIRTTQIQTTDENRFWMIGVEGCKGPKKRYDDFTAAYAEAVRMAACNSGRDVAIMESVGSIIIGNPETNKDRKIASLQKCKAALEKMITQLSADESKDQ